MDSTVLIVIVATLLIDVVIITFVVRKKMAQRQRTAALLTAAAESEGWTNVPTVDARRIYHLQGTIAPNITWSLSAQRPGKKSSSFSKAQHTLWRTRDVRLEGKVIAVCLGTNMASSDVDVGHSLIQLSLRRIFGQDAASDLANLKIVDMADDTFSRHYMVLSDDEHIARQFMKDPVPSILLDWQSAGMPMPGILIRSEGMQVRFTKMIDDVETLRKIVMLCGALAVRGKEIVREEKWV